MKRKTISLDTDIYLQIKRQQATHESLSAALRRMLRPEGDPTDYLEELRRVPPKADLALLRRRQAGPPRSSRVKARRHAA